MSHWWCHKQTEAWHDACPATLQRLQCLRRSSPTTGCGRKAAAIPPAPMTFVTALRVAMAEIPAAGKGGPGIPSRCVRCVRYVRHNGFVESWLWANQAHIAVIRRNFDKVWRLAPTKADSVLLQGMSAGASGIQPRARPWSGRARHKESMRLAELAEAGPPATAIGSGRDPQVEVGLGRRLHREAMRNRGAAVPARESAMARKRDRSACCDLHTSAKGERLAYDPRARRANASAPPHPWGARLPERTRARPKSTSFALACPPRLPNSTRTLLGFRSPCTIAGRWWCKCCSARAMPRIMAKRSTSVGAGKVRSAESRL